MLVFQPKSSQVPHGAEPVVSEFCKLVEETEPRLLAFHIYVTEDQGSEVVVHIHPDADSMLYHLEVMGNKVRVFAGSVRRSWEIMGSPMMS